MKISVLLLLLLISTSAVMAQDTTIEADTMVENGIKYLRTTACIAGRETVRGDDPDGGFCLYDRNDFFDTQNNIWLTEEHGSAPLVKYVNMSFRYYKDREKNSDGTFTELMVVNQQTFGGTVCSLIHFDSKGKQLDSISISKRQFNAIAKKRNQQRKQLLTKENAGATILNVPLLPFSTFGK